MKKERTWSRDNPEAALAAVNLRIAGVSERRVFETFRDLLEETHRPSYRDLRAAFGDREVLKRHEATELRRAELKYDKRGEKVHGTSEFLYRRVNQFGSKDAIRRLERKMAVGYLIGNKLPDQHYNPDDRDLVEFIESEYETGSP